MATRVLIVRFSSIGDIVLTTPVVRAVREQARAEVHFLTKAAFAPVLADNPHLHRLWTIRRDVSELAADLAAAGFTHLIDLHANLRTLELRARLAAAALRRGRRPPRYAAFRKLNSEKFLLTRLGIDRMPEVHIVDRYLAAATAALGVTNDGRGLDYFIAPADRVEPSRHGLPEDYLALVIGAAHATKRLTEEQLTAFCRGLDYPTVLLGGPGEAATGERIARAAGPGVHNGCGRFRLGQSADLVRRARAVVTHDTGLMHVAAAFRRPILSVWGNTVPELGMYPYLPGQESLERARRREVRGLACRPCSKIGYPACPRGHFRCIRDQRPADLVAAARELLSALR